MAIASRVRIHEDTIARGLVLMGVGKVLLASVIASSCAIAPVIATPILAQEIAQTRGDRPLLQMGSEGEAVSELQAALKLLGYYDGEVDGVYRESTATAVAEFQAAAGLSADGIVGSRTWNRLFPDAAANEDAEEDEPDCTCPETTEVSGNLPVLKRGMRGSAVTVLQSRLQSQGFLSGAADGIFGENTEAAVRDAQVEFGLEPNGIVDARTWEALLR
jgi:peptidoglycan hydrolase-like protein with peptidoglycan-binding domain